jgi:hypothetical protein
MNKIIISALIACGLLLLDSPEAAAHETRVTQDRWPAYGSVTDNRREKHSRDFYSRERYYDHYSRDRYRYRDYYGANDKRAKKMPRWLKHNKSFRHWFKHTRLKKNHHLSWHQLFDIYRWEFSYARYRKH